MDRALESSSVCGSEGQAIVIDLVVFISAGLVLLIGFLVLGLQAPPKNADAAALAAVSQMVNLETTQIIRADRLLNDAEYQLLRSNPDLSSVAAQLRKDRREIALLWINVLLTDMKTLWRFRRFVIQRGAPTRASEEWAIFRSLIAALIVLNLLKLSVLTLGPFALARLAGHACRGVETMSCAAANVLGRIPAAGWSDVERAWMNAGV